MVGSLALTAGTLLALAGIAFFEGPTALVELPGLFANLFSYLRLMALGLSGVIIAGIINQIKLDPSTIYAHGFNAGALATFLIFGAIFVASHLGALALGLFESFIQSLRLQYVEFFSKFYKGGGVAFAPLRETDES